MTMLTELNTLPLAIGPRVRRRRYSISRMCCMAIAAGASTIALGMAILYSCESIQHHEAAGEVTRLAGTLAHLRTDAELQTRQTSALIADLRKQLQQRQAEAPSASPDNSAAADAALQHQVEQAQNALAAAVSESTRLTETLHKSQSEAAVIPDLKAALAASDVRQKSLQSACDSLREQLAALQTQEQALKDQLLIAAAQSTDDSDAASSPSDPAPASAAEIRWALGISFDTAKGFASLCFDRESIHDAPTGHQNLRRTSATRASNAALFRFTSDAPRQRVYDAALTVSLAADGPHDRLVENTRLVQLFLHTFAPAFRDPDAWLNNTVKQLAGHSPSDRLVLLDTTFKITAYNDGGNFTFKVESPHDDLDE
ncbi:MAG TPA: hypothetical protein VG893_09810 [Terracidiphilus sp.]|nr:hypothetical protein [Phycisphaerae bacterium]HVZ83955.1 hypothetical protein [Terracidiphilus sp.]